MKTKLLQLICLIAGVAFLAFGAGLIGGRITHKPENSDAHAVRDVVPPPQPPEPADAPTTSPQPQAENVPEDITVTASPPLQASPPGKEAFATTAPVVEDSFLSRHSRTAGEKEAASQRETKYVVQVLSTPNRPDAAEARNKMITAGYPAGIFEADLGDKGMWYRIYVGPYDTESEAQAAQNSVRKMTGFASSFVKALE